MKISKSAVHWKARALPEIRFEDQQLTSFAGLVVFQPLFERLALKKQLAGCFAHLKVSPIFGHGAIVMLLIVHLLIGYRRLSDLRFYEDDPLVKRVLGLKRLPDVATVSRTLEGVDRQALRAQRELSRSIVLERLKRLAPARVTLDFDGSVLGTTRFAEGTAVGYNRKKKGQRSYYPLFCTVAQTGQVLDVWHRPGNVHDSNGARRFWHRADRTTRFFACRWKPKCWDRERRFLFIRTREPRQRKEPVQLRLFAPCEYGFQFKMILTNMSLSARKVLALHNGRGAQEGIFAELKSQTQMDYVPCKRLAANQTWLLAAIMAHNLNRKLQMSVEEPTRSTTEQRMPWWTFVRLGTRRMNLIQRAGRLTRPNGCLTLTMSANPAVQSELLHYLKALAA
ncbi:MAG: transposase [Gammaproteobacteria bacterium]|nr:transposase [Gammaproteobacteria bacterium]